MSKRCACGRFALLPGGMAQIEDGIYHAEAGAPACELLALRARLEEAERLLTEFALPRWAGLREAIAKGPARLDVPLKYEPGTTFACFPTKKKEDGDG